MHPLPHHYRALARGGATGVVTVRAEGLPDLATQPPPERMGLATTQSFGIHR